MSDIEELIRQRIAEIEANIARLKRSRRRWRIASNIALGFMAGMTALNVIQGTLINWLAVGLNVLVAASVFRSRAKHR